MKKILILVMLALSLCLLLVGCDEGEGKEGTNSTASMLPVGSSGAQVAPEDVSGAINDAVQNGDLDVNFEEFFGGEIILPDVEL